MANEIPDFDEMLGGMLAALKPHQRPVLMAMLERVAAGRYELWARDEKYVAHRETLLACAARETQIAERVEALYDDVPSVQREVQAAMPQLAGVEDALFGGRSVPEQFAVLETGERAGGRVWERLAKEAEGPAREAMAACVQPEIDNADALRGVLASLG